ncbi:unnamed protein product, partial [Prorocentrum cordatum]
SQHVRRNDLASPVASSALDPEEEEEEEEEEQSPSAVVQPGIAPSASPAGAARDRAGGVAGASSQSSAPVGCFSGLRAKVRRRPATRAPRPRTAGRMPPESGPRLARGPGRSRSVLGLPLECQPAADQSSVRDAFVHP